MYIVNDVLSSMYVFLGNISEDELDSVIAIEQLNATFNEMKVEELVSSQNNLIIKNTITLDTSGIGQNNTPDGTIVLVKLNGEILDNVPYTNLSLLSDDVRQGVSFYSDGTQNLVELAIAEHGDLEVWYEPDQQLFLPDGSEIKGIPKKFFYALVTRAAKAALAYVMYDVNRIKNPDQYRRNIGEKLQEESENWKEQWKTDINKSRQQRPFVKRPFMAGY